MWAEVAGSEAVPWLGMLFTCTGRSKGEERRKKEKKKRKEKVKKENKREMREK